MKRNLGRLKTCRILNFIARNAVILRVAFLKFKAIQRIPMGSIIKTVTFYERPFWREKGMLLISLFDMSIFLKKHYVY